MTAHLTDEDLLELGFAPMPAEDRSMLLHAAHEDLERRVGQRISDTLEPAQMDEWERLEAEPTEAEAWLEAREPGYRLTAVFRHELARAAEARVPDPHGVAATTSALHLWLRHNAPDFQRIVSEEVRALRADLRLGRDGLLAATRRR